MKKTNSRIKKKEQKKVLILLLSLAVLCLILLFEITLVYKKTTTTSIEKENKQIIRNYEFSFVAVGDALLHDGVYKDAATNQKDENGYTKYDFKSMLTDVKEVIKDYDLKFYNQETIIGGKSIGLSTYPCFNSPDEIGLDMMDAGFNIVNLATNHTLDRGEKAILYSTDFWKKQNMYAIGSYSSKEDRDKVEVKDQNGITYSILSYTTLTNGIKIPDGKTYLVNVYDDEQAKKDIEAIRDKVDVLMVSMHWGTEYTHTPTTEQRRIAAYLASLGVDVIIGHHPHVIEPIEYIDDTLVIYSLGNFLSAQEGTMKRVGMIAAFTVKKTLVGSTKNIEINNIKADLLWTYHQNYKNFKVIPFPYLKDSELQNHDQIYQEYMKKINTTNDSRIQLGFIKR